MPPERSSFCSASALHLLRLASVVRRNGVVRRDGARIVSVGTEFAPFSFLGFVFLNEHGLEPGDVRRILAHERVHIRQLHSLDLLLMELATILLWFNPLVWPFKKSLQVTHEYLADAGVIAQGFGGNGYRRLVFEQHVGVRLFGVGNSFKQSQIHRRIFMMSRNPSAGGSRWKCLLAVPAALALVVLFAVPRLASSATPAGQDKADQAKMEKMSQEKAAQAAEEIRKIEQMQIELKSAFQATEDEAKRGEIKAKLEQLAQKRQDLTAKLEAQGHPYEVGGPRFRGDDEAQADGREDLAELSETTDPAVKAELEKKLVELKAKASAMGKPVFKGIKPSELPPMAEIQAKLASLKEKEAEVRSELGRTENDEKKIELKKTLQMILEKQEAMKELAVKAKMAGAEKIAK